MSKEDMMVNFSLDYNMLARLTQTFGPSGRETGIAELISDYARLYASAIETDSLGNLIVRKHGSGPKIMIACHMDEVGIMVTHISEKGFLYFAPVGGLRSELLAAKRVVFANGVIGIISREINHKDNKTKDKDKSEKLFIDIGASSQSEARRVVNEGDMAVLVGDYYENDGFVFAKALDNRAGCFVVLEVLKHVTSSHDLYFVFTAQEEVGARGAKTAAYALEPDLAIIMDTTISFDVPKEQDRVSLNRGVAVKVMDRSIVVSPKIKNWMTDVAAGLNILFQSEIITTGGTDSGPVHLTRSGIPTGGLAVPVRYLHSGNEIAAKKDIEAAVSLLYELLLDSTEHILSDNKK